jgi:hypothetical protein
MCVCVKISGEFHKKAKCDSYLYCTTYRWILFMMMIKKSKAVPLHAMEAHGGRGGIAPTHS